MRQDLLDEFLDLVNDEASPMGLPRYDIVESLSLCIVEHVMELGRKGLPRRRGWRYRRGRSDGGAGSVHLLASLSTTSAAGRGPHRYRGGDVACAGFFDWRRTIKYDRQRRWKMLLGSNCSTGSCLGNNFLSRRRL